MAFFGYRRFDSAMSYPPSLRSVRAGSLFYRRNSRFSDLVFRISCGEIAENLLFGRPILVCASDFAVRALEICFIFKIFCPILVCASGYFLVRWWFFWCVLLFFCAFFSCVVRFLCVGVRRVRKLSGAPNFGVRAAKKWTKSCPISANFGRKFPLLERDFDVFSADFRV